LVSWLIDRAGPGTFAVCGRRPRLRHRVSGAGRAGIARLAYSSLGLELCRRSTAAGLER